MVATFLADQAQEKKVATLAKYAVAINEAHRLAGYEAPSQSREVRAVMKGIRRTLGTAQKGKKPLRVAHLREIVRALPRGVIGARDRALLLVGFAGALRRSELVGLDVEDLEFTDEGLVITIKRSKVDQEGEGRPVGIPYGSNPATCPIRTLKKWMTIGGIIRGPLFRPVTRHWTVSLTRLGTRAVGVVVKKAVKAIGLDAKGYSGHSLRAGLATEAAAKGVAEGDIMRQTGHKSAMTLRKYIRPETLWINNAAAGVGL